VQAPRALSRLPIRLKLTLGYTGAIAVVLSAIGIFLYLQFETGLDDGIDQALRTRAGDLVTVVHGSSRLSSTRPLIDRGEDFAQVLDADGRVVETSPRRKRPLLRRQELRKAATHDLLVDRGEHTRLRAEPVHDRRGLVVVVGVSLQQREKALETLNGALLLGGPLALLLASGVGYGLASGALRPVESMRRRAATISAAETDARLPLPEARDEIFRLGATLNQMLGRLALALEHERRFVSDASHELRTPLAILKAEIDVALRRDTPKAELRAALASAGEETDRLARLAEDLLVIARSDQGELRVRRDPIDLDDVLAGVAKRFEHRCRQAGRSIEVMPSERAVIDADDGRLEQALGNLIDNALRHGAGSVSLSARRDDGAIELHVRDEGAGFPEDFLGRAFERFSRADPARSAGGAGLGLAIVQAIARAHGGEARAANVGAGADVWLRLPVSRS
jgi:signal transduction histidine kinase